jgi:hypothetical protein
MWETRVRSSDVRFVHGHLNIFSFSRSEYYRKSGQALLPVR